MASPCLAVNWFSPPPRPSSLGRSGMEFSKRARDDQLFKSTVRWKIAASVSSSRGNGAPMLKAQKYVQEEPRTNGRGDRMPPPAEEDKRIRLPSNVDYISSVGNPYVKHLVKLRRSAATRQSTSSVLIMGSIPLREVCESVEFDAEVQGGVGIISVLLVREDVSTPEGLTRFSQRVVRVSVAVMSKITGLDSPPESMGVLSYPPSFTSLKDHQESADSQLHKWCPSPRRILVLDAIQDPGNLGTLIRTAAAFGWDGLFLLPGCCDPFNEKALRAARGASFRVPIAVGSWHHVRQLAAVNDLKLFAGEPEPLASDARGKNSPQNRNEKMSKDFGGVAISLDLHGDINMKLKPLISSQEGLCLVLGSEGQGLSEDILNDCTPVGIPMPGRFESLNVAVAGGILMFLLR
ncbi:hypothetical protein R1sor_019339 [Riccia sorocarpa]|uniref:tRNA/rRNA methyltransferase SpoU type domain-containing protein n=1 Tax=Riccia sorocarpa TaxID=122646 RepID=A0ABD3IEZ0_9MARC